MTDRQVLEWLESKRNGAHSQLVSLPQLVRELRALVTYSAKLENND